MIVPVVILNGFLGSGKTTLLRNLLVQSHEKDISIGVIVNDMSELDVDGELVANTEVVEEENHTLISIHNCIISSRKGIEELDKALKKIVSKHEPELIIIETSGSGHPMPLIEFFQSQTKFKLTGVLALADSLMLARDYNNGQLVVPLLQYNMQIQKRDTINLLTEQIMFCSHLILTKADRLEKGKLQEIAQSIHPLNPYVSIVSVRFGNLAIEELLEMPEYNYHRVAQLAEEIRPVLEADLEDERPYNLATRIIKNDRPFHPQRLWDACQKYLDQKIYRSKGFFWLASRDKLSLLWNQAAGNISLEMIGYWRSGIVESDDHSLTEMEIEQLKEMLAKETGRFGDRSCDLTVIGDKTQVDTFTEALESCFLTEKEIEHYLSGGQFDDPWPKNMVKLA
jgi:G3E family GTPase